MELLNFTKYQKVIHVRNQSHISDTAEIQTWDKSTRGETIFNERVFDQPLPRTWRVPCAVHRLAKLSDISSAALPLVVVGQFYIEVARNIGVEEGSFKVEYHEAIV